MGVTKDEPFDASKTDGYCKIPRGVFRDMPLIGLHAFAVYCCISYYQREDSRPFLAVKTIAKLCQMGTTKAREALRILECRGWIASFRRFDSSSQYVARMIRDRKHPLEYDAAPPTPGVAPCNAICCRPPHSALPNKSVSDNCVAFGE